MNNKGFILISMLIMMLLLAVTAMALNRRAGLQSRMAGNQIRSSQTSLGQSAALEKTVWDLTRDPLWRTDSSGEDYIYNGTTYTRKVLNSTVSGYTDAVTVTATAKGASTGVTASFRYYLDDILYVSKPNQVYVDGWNNIYFADDGNHSVFKVDGATQVMTRVAGNGTSTSGNLLILGDGGPATDATLDDPYGVWVDAAGVIYIADRDNHRIRRVDPAGNISTFAGTGTGGYNDDGIQAATAHLNKPRAVYGDTAGNIYIADSANHIIRKVDPSGVISTIAGIPDNDGYTGDDGPATSAGLDNPKALFVSSTGVIYIADTDNHCIRKVDTDGNISTIVGDGTACDSAANPSCGDGGLATSAQLSGPRGVYLDESSGYIYIADTNNHRIRWFIDGGNIETYAGTGAAGYAGDEGAAVSAQIDTPRGVFARTGGEIVIADNMNSCLREVDNGDVITTITGSGDPGFNHPENIAMDGDGNIYIADKDNHRIRKLEPSGKVTTVAGTGSGGYSGDGGAATSAQLNHPNDVFVDSAGNIYIADTDNHVIRKVDTVGDISTVAGDGTLVPGDSGDNGAATSAKLDSPKGVYVDSSGNIYIADTNNCRIRMVTAATGVIDRIAGKPGLSSGRCLYEGDGPANAKGLNKPHGVFVDTSGNFYIADTDSHIIRKVAAGQMTTVAGTPTISGYSGDYGAAASATLTSPKSVFVDGAGNLFVADQGNHVIRMVSAGDQKIYTLAGTGSGGFNFDDQPAVEAQLNSPGGVVMATTRGGQKIYISDKDNNRIRILSWKLARALY